MIEFVFINGILYMLVGGCIVNIAMLARKGKKLGTSKLGNKKSLGRLSGENGFILSKHHQLNFKKSCEGCLIIAPPGEGKTAGEYFPELLSNHFPKSSIVAGDLKGELYKKTVAYQKSIGRKVVVFEPLGNMAKYNPLSQCRNLTEVRELASNLLQNAELAMQLESGRSSGSAEWVNMAVPLFTAALLYVKNQNGSIPQALKLLIYSTEEELLSKLGNSKDTDIMEQYMMYQASLESKGTSAGIKTTLLTSLQIFTDHQLINAIEKTDFTALDLRKEPTCLYIKYDKSTYLAPFLSIFYTQLINQLKEYSGLPIAFLLDEFQNLGRIGNIMSTLATCREPELAFKICLQNISRLYSIYGKDNTMTILNCLKTKCVLPSLSDSAALQYISELCGETEINITHENGKVTKTSRKLFTPDEVRRLSNDGSNSDDKVLIIAHNKLPILDDLDLYFNNEKYNKNIS